MQFALWVQAHIPLHRELPPGSGSATPGSLGDTGQRCPQHDLWPAPQQDLWPALSGIRCLEPQIPEETTALGRCRDGGNSSITPARQEWEGTATMLSLLEQLGSRRWAPGTGRSFVIILFGRILFNMWCLQHPLGPTRKPRVRSAVSCQVPCSVGG